MRISVVVPAFNAARTIAACIDSILAQDAPPHEVWIANDGSTDETAAILDAYSCRVSVVHQTNQGVAAARNTLIQKCSGELIAFLDADDIWHPEVTRTHAELFQRRAEVVASVLGHWTFRGYASFSFPDNDQPPQSEVIQPLDFIRRYNRDPGPFGSPSYICVRREILDRIRPAPFHPAVSGADDFLLMNFLPLFGPIAYCSQKLVAYRETPESISASRLKAAAKAVQAFDILLNDHRTMMSAEQARAYRSAHAAKKRRYAKFLMGARDHRRARSVLFAAITGGFNLPSVAKTLRLLLLSYLPRRLQPTWPAAYDSVRGSSQ